MEERHLSVARTARYFALGAPAGRARAVWVLCHGYGQLAARFLERFRTLDDGRRRLVAPEGLSRFYLSERAAERRVGASWMTREDRLAEIDDYVAYLDAVYDDVLGTGPASAPVTALGFSQGAATACRWVALGRARVDRLVVWGGEVPPDLDLGRESIAARVRAARLTLVYGRADPFFTATVVADTEARLRRHAIPYALHPFDGEHEIDEATLRQLAEQGER